jgi:hypothetical protein
MEDQPPAALILKGMPSHGDKKVKYFRVALVFDLI